MRGVKRGKVPNTVKGKTHDRTDSALRIVFEGKESRDTVTIKGDGPILKNLKRVAEVVADFVGTDKYVVMPDTFGSSERNNFRATKQDCGDGIFNGLRVGQAVHVFVSLLDGGGYHWRVSECTKRGWGCQIIFYLFFERLFFIREGHRLF